MAGFLNAKVSTTDYCLSYRVLVLSVLALALGAIYVVYMCWRKVVAQDAKGGGSSRCGNG